MCQVIMENFAEDIMHNYLCLFTLGYFEVAMTSLPSFKDQPNRILVMQYDKIAEEWSWNFRTFELSCSLRCCAILC
mgnify:CR=1 FL=1